MKKHICIVDGSGFMHRARGIAKPMYRADGQDIGVTNLFAKMIRKVVRRANQGNVPPTHWALAFDPPRADSWRRKIHAGYKAHREEPEQSFVDQIPLMQECCREAGFPVIKAPHHEADDVLAAYALDAHEQGYKVTLITSDKDLMQLVRPGILLWDARADAWFKTDDVTNKFGIPPERLADYLALAGDVADGIPGAKGIGPKAAVGILEKGHALHQVVNNPELIENKRWRTLVEKNKQELLLAARLVALDAAGCPRPLSLDELAVERTDLLEECVSLWMKENLV